MSYPFSAGVAGRTMTLADLLDLEAQLARDRDTDTGALEARDRALLGNVASPGAGRGQRQALLRRWLQALRDSASRQAYPGRAVAGVLGGLRALLALAGLLLGWGAATAVLRYSGGAPVNVWDFLLAFVGVQLLLFALLVSSFLFPIASLGLPLLGLFRSALAALYPRLAARALRGQEERLAQWAGFWHRLRSRRSLYHHVEPWILLGLTQAFGVAFNVGALLGCLRLVVFSDLAFAWSTTLLQLDVGRFHAIAHTLAAPFAWLWPEADPTRALVEATRYSRLDAAYLASGARRSAHPELVGGWWPFLIGCLVTYGLLPRLATLALATARARWSLARLPLDDAEVTRLVRRLSEPHVETRSPEREVEGPARSGPPQVPAPMEAREARCAVVLWRDVPGTPLLEAAAARQARCPVAGVHAAGGRDHPEGAADWPHLVDGADPVVVVAEGWEAPDKAALRLLAELRRAMGAKRHLLVLLVDAGQPTPRAPTAAQLRIWQEGLATLEDPYLAVEPLREGS
jgi:Protein of unknown function (DUF2868)